MYSFTDFNHLRAALQASPDNVLIQKLLADALLKIGQVSEAEQLYRKALHVSPDDTSLKLGLAMAFHQNGKASAALVVLEDLIQENNAEAYLLSAKLFFAQQQFNEARDYYQRALLLDERLRDEIMDANLSGNELDRIPLFLNEDEGEAYDLESEKPKISFADVGGMDAVKEEIALKIIFPIKYPDLYKTYGKQTGGGILLYGPPGCGKTYLARAIAGEISSTFITVGLNEILDMWIGASESNLHDFFQHARQSTPCVLFFDEVDALGASRNDMRKSASRTITNQFLEEFDGSKYSNEGMLILAATNSPWLLDTAFRRPGRFDRVIFVAPPNAAAREQILQLHLRNVPTLQVDLATIAAKTEAFSGADLKAVIDRAIERKLLEAIKIGHAIPLNTDDLLNAVEAHNPTLREWFTVAKNFALYGSETGQYQPILEFMKTQNWL